MLHCRNAESDLLKKCTPLNVIAQTMGDLKSGT
jgi:hypothetical protein